MRLENKLVSLGGALAALLLHLPAHAQTGRPSEPARASTPTAAPEDVAAEPDCTQPADSKEAKVIDFDATTGTARLAVNLGAGRFTLVTIKTWAREGDARPLTPVIEAARSMQGVVRFHSPKLTANPASSINEFVVAVDMGGGPVCWATPSALLTTAAAPSSTRSDGAPAPGGNTGTTAPSITPPSESSARTVRPRTPPRTPTPANEPPVPQ